MKILFVSTYCVAFYHDHVFTVNVYNELRKQCQAAGHELKLCTFTVLKYPNDYYQRLSEFGDYEIVELDPSQDFSQQFADYFRYVNPDIIHSNMIEGWDIEGAKLQDIPIFNTIHLGAFMCPRGGGQGFLRYDDSICQREVDKHCDRCMAQLLPFPRISYTLHKIIPRGIEHYVASHLKRQVLYLSAFLRQTTEPENKLRFLETARYAHIIAGNKALVHLLKLNGLEERVHLLPHGIVPRESVRFPRLTDSDPVKFYFLGSTTYSKGLHVLLNAFKRIPHHLYELHIIGDISHAGKKEKAYFERIKTVSKGLNIFFDGRVLNKDLEKSIANYHVMIHPAISHEVYGLTLAESLSMGRPVIATRCGGAEMQVIDGHNGWLVNPNDASDLRRAIMEAIENHSEIKRRASNAITPHLVQPYVSSLLQLYQDAIQN